MSDLASDFTMVVRNIVAEIHGRGPRGSVILDGRVSTYTQKSNILSVALTHYTQKNGDPFILAVPYSMFMAGDTYGDYFYPEEGLLCTIAVVEGDTGESIQINFAHDGLMPPANLTGSSSASPYQPSIIAPLQPGERLILHKAGFALRFMANGGIQMGGVTNGGQYPTAVEGSAIAAGTAFLLWISQVQIALNGIAPGSVVPPFPVTAGTTIGAVAVGQGAQSVLLPGPGQI